MRTLYRAIFDTNLFVGAGFNPRSASAHLIQTARNGEITLIWDVPTQTETCRILSKIPRLSWESVADLYLPEHRWPHITDLGAVAFVTDPEDRKFAALSTESGATLVSSDSDLLEHRDRLNVRTPSEFLRSLTSPE